MRLPDSNNVNLGAKRIPMGLQNDPFSNPKIQTEGQPATNNPFGTFNEFATNTTMQNMAGSVLKDQISGYSAGYMDYFSFDIVRPYFHIDNSYILKKLTLIFVPFVQKGDWKSTGDEDYMQSKMEYESYRTNMDRVDPYGVDLYLPIMSLTTLILVIGFYYGAIGMFDPELLGYLVGK